MTEQLAELDSRSDRERSVTLLWRRSDNRLFVTVDDRTTGESLRIRVRAGDSPLDVFHHPYAYADWNGVEPTPAVAG